MSVDPLDAARPRQPYPGLRPFEPNEWPIFFGRERMIDEVIERLARDRLVVIHGASGSGKSSLVRAGVMPKLARQHLRHGAPSVTCALRPSGGPLWNLATEFAKLEGRASDLTRIETIHGLFNRREATLASIAGALDGVSGKSLCVLVDQFEELFRYEKETSREAAELFMELIGRAATTVDGEPSKDAAEVHVVVTMRSEFLGECARFDGLAETINRTQYLVPRMDDDAPMRAVRRPAQMYDAAIEEALAARLIASVRGREDELPLLQHGLMLMWEEAARAKTGEPIVLDGATVEKAGGLAELLSGHADRVMDAAAPDARRAGLAEVMFRELTDVNAEGSAIRRPRALRELAAAAGATPDELHPLVDAFRAPGVSFLTPYAPASLGEKTVVDISHEALIRCWRRIASPKDGWLKQEFDDGLAWRSLLVEAKAFEKDQGRVLSAAATEDRSKLFDARGEAWSRRYGGGWSLVGNLLAASRKAVARARGWKRAVAIALTALTIGAVVAFIVSFAGWSKAEAEKNRADRNEKLESAFVRLVLAKPSSSDSASTQALLAQLSSIAESDKNDSAAEMLGPIYDKGFGVPRSHKDSIIWYTKAAEHEVVFAMTMLGDVFEFGDRVNGVPSDHFNARIWYERAASAHDPDPFAMRNLGRLYQVGHDDQPPDPAKALEWYEKAAELGNAVAFCDLGLLIDRGQNVPPDFAKARDWRRAALRPKAADRRICGLRDESGEGGGQQDFAKAREWYERAAASDDAIAMRNLGLLYENARSGSQNFATTRDWLERAAAADDTIAMRCLGLLFENGQTGWRDYAKAREWFEKAAAANDPFAMRSLGFFYQNGVGGSLDYPKAREWYEKAANAGDTFAMRSLGLLYQNTQAGLQDYVKAREWYEKAAAVGAKRNCGSLFESGQGETQDAAKARTWFEKRAATGTADDVQALAAFNERTRQRSITEARAQGRYADALRLEEDWARSVEAGETQTASKPEVTAGQFGNMSSDALFAREFERALTAAERAHMLDPSKLWIEVNRAHALMFLDRTEEARALYLSHRDEPVLDGRNKSCRQAIADDFVELRKAGLVNPLMEDVESALAAKAP